jgi:uncharacterized protein (TIGR02391 family)
MIFFTTYVTVIRRGQEWTETRRGTPARVEGTTVRLPIGTDVQVGDHLEQLLANDQIRRMLVIDVVSPYMPGTSDEDDYIQVTCVPVERVTFPPFVAPVLHPAMSVPVKLAEDGRTSEAVTEAFRLVEDRVRSLTGSDGSGRTLIESVFGTRPPKLDVATAVGAAAKDEREGFRLLFLGAMLGLRSPSMAAGGVPATLEETLEYLSLASMLIRRLDRAEARLG